MSPQASDRRSGTRPAPPAGVELLAELVRRLTERDRAILDLVHEHRVLSTDQLERMFFARPRTARERLATLRRLGAVESVRLGANGRSSPAYWVLAPAGADVVAAMRGVTVAELGYRRDSTLQVCFSRRMGHLHGVNDFFSHLYGYARRHPDKAELVAWWPERRCARTWGQLVRPNAYGRWKHDGQTVHFFLEHDTGSRDLNKIAAKIAAYARLVGEASVCTPVLVWLASPRREARLRALLERTPTVPVATAVQTHLGDPLGPAGPVWLPLGQACPRRTLADVAGAWAPRQSVPRVDQLRPALLRQRRSDGSRHRHLQMSGRMLLRVVRSWLR